MTQSGGCRTAESIRRPVTGIGRVALRPQWVKSGRSGQLLFDFMAPPLCLHCGVTMMQIRSFNAPSAPQGFHAQVCAVEGATRLAFVSGQVPATAEGAVPESLAEQSRLIWRNIEAQLAEVGMSLDNVVKATTFLSDRKYAIEN